MKVICFDLDDTLYSEIDYLKSAYSEIVNFAYSKTKVSPPPTSKEVWSEMVAVYLRGENEYFITYANWRVHDQHRDSNLELDFCCTLLKARCACRCLDFCN